MTNFFKKYSNIFSYVIIFGIAVFLFPGPLGVGIGIAMGTAFLQHEDKKK